MLREPLIFLTIAGLLGLLAWAAPGQTAGNSLVLSDLQALTGECQPAVDASRCSEATELSLHTVGSTPNGELFMVMRGDCSQGADCQAWLVEKADDDTYALLTVSGQIKLYGGNGRYPSVMVKARLSETQSSYESYEWDGAAYLKVASDVVYRVDGVECGTAEECKHAAQRAIDEKRYDDAVKIWQTVFGVAWI